MSNKEYIEAVNAMLELKKLNFEIELMQMLLEMNISPPKEPNA